MGQRPAELRGELLEAADHLDHRGISRARNAAHAHVRTGWIAYPDDDAEVARDVIERLAAVLARQPEAAFVQARVVFPDQRPMQPGMDERARALERPAETLRTTVSRWACPGRSTLACGR